MAACSGAQTENVLPYYTVAAGQAKPANAFGQQGVGQFRELSQLDRGFVDEDTSLVTLSIGGNDSRFGDVVQQCIIGLSLCQDATLSGDTAPLTTSEPALIKGKVEDSIVVTLQEIRRRAPHAKIVLMGYPLLFERSGSCVAGIGTSEAPWLNEMGNVLGAHMGEAVDRAGGAAGGFWFSDPRDEFRPDGLDRDGHAVCGDPEKVHGIVTTQTKGDKPLLSFPWPGRDPGIGPSQQSFHPKKEGQLAYAQSLDETLGRMGR
jgi:hypothetical protein